MPSAIARIAKLKGGNIAASEQHTLRQRETPNANPEVENIRFIGQPLAPETPKPGNLGHGTDWRLDDSLECSARDNPVKSGEPFMGDPSLRVGVVEFDGSPDFTRFRSGAVCGDGLDCQPRTLCSGAGRQLLAKPQQPERSLSVLELVAL